MTTPVHVAVAVIRNNNGEVFITQRPDHVHQGRLWEFPGGKVETQETVFDALKREILEENDIAILQAQPLIRIPYRYPDKNVLLDVWEVLEYKGEPHGKEGQPFRWIKPQNLGQLTFPAANHAIISAVQLPSCYLVTPEVEANKDLFLQRLSQSIEFYHIRMLYFRSKVLSFPDYKNLAKDIIAMCSPQDVSVMLNADPDSVVELGAAGLHVTASELMDLNSRPLSNDFWLSASCHNLLEIEQANTVGVDFVCLGSVGETSSHEDIQPLGWNRFSQLAEVAAMPVYAIGGMTLSDVEKSRTSGGQGIAAISALWK